MRATDCLRQDKMLKDIREGRFDPEGSGDQEQEQETATQKWSNLRPHGEISPTRAVDDKIDTESGESDDDSEDSSQVAS